MTEQIHSAISRETLLGAHIAYIKADAHFYFCKEHLDAIKKLCIKQGIDTKLTSDELEQINKAYWQEYNRLKGIAK